MQDPYGLIASGLPPELAAQAMGLNRQQLIANALMNQSMEPVQNVGGVGAPLSPLQGLAQIVKAYAAQKLLKDSDKGLSDIASKQRQGVADAMAKYEQTRMGSPSPPDAVGGGPALPGDPRAAVAQAMTNPYLAKNPVVAADIKSMQKAQEPYSLRQGEQRFIGSVPVATNAPKPEPPKTQRIGVTLPNGQPGVVEAQYDPKTNKWTPIEGAVPTPKFAPPQQVNVSLSTEKKYGEQFAGNIAKADVELRDAAMKAPELADRSNRIAELLGGNVITGTGANFRLGFAKAAKLAGLTNSDSPENTELLGASLAQNTLDAIKASGLGSGSGFSNADRDFLEKAVGGKITMEPQALRRLAELSHKAATASAQRWNQRVKDIPEDAIKGTGISREAIRTAPFNSGKSIQDQADAILRGDR